MITIACKKRTQGGFTLMETLVAVTILAFGPLAVVTLLSVSFTTSTLAKNTTKATELAAWMLDRVRQDSSLETQPITAKLTSVRSYDNDATPAFVIDTDQMALPANEPGRTAYAEWRALIQGAAIPNYIGADTLRGDRLPRGQGILTIIPNDVNNGGNHTVIATVSWSLAASKGILDLRKGIQLETILASAE